MSVFDKLRGMVRGAARGAVSQRSGSRPVTIPRNSIAGRAAGSGLSYFQQAYRTGNHARLPAHLRRNK